MTINRRGGAGRRRLRGTSRFFTVEIKAGYRVDKHITLALGVDNLTDRRDFAYHPYPSRTFSGQLKWRL